MPGLQPDHVQKLHELIHAKQIIQAIQLYREATGVSLTEAKEAIEEMRLIEVTKPPSGARNYDNPVLEGKIKSLLNKGKKIDAVKIYRAEYGLGLKEAKDAVDRIEASMPRVPRDSAGGMPYEPVIGSDPFAENKVANNRGKIVILAAVALVVLCAAAAFLLILLSNP